MAGGVLVNACVVLTLYGCCVAYLITATQLLEDTPLSLWYCSLPPLMHISGLVPHTKAVHH
jgi:amino acid permease